MLETKFGSQDRTRLALRLIGLLGVSLIIRFVRHEARPNYYLLSSLDMYSGESAAIPAIVNEALAIARRHRVKTVGLEGTLEKDPLTYERLIEGLYPIRVDAGGKLMLTDMRTISEKCMSIERGQMVALVECR